MKDKNGLALDIGDLAIYRIKQYNKADSRDILIAIICRIDNFEFLGKNAIVQINSIVDGPSVSVKASQLEKFPDDKAEQEQVMMLLKLEGYEIEEMAHV